MANFRLYKPVNNALDDIWEYTVKTWDEAQAATYIQELFDTIQQAADREIFWHKLKTHIGLEVYFVKHKKHYLFFKQLDNETIGIINIIHEQRDLVSVLKRSLKQLN